MGVTRPPRVYRPPVAGEPLRLREDGHWSTRGLVGYWPMREMWGHMTQDLSPFGNHGTLVNMDPETAWQGGTDGAAVMFGGSDDRIACGTFDPSDGALTLVARAYITNATQALITKRDTWAVGGMRWQWMYAKTHAPLWQFKTSTTLRTIPWTFSLGWHTFTMTNTPGGLYSMYVDGALIGTTTALVYDTKTTAQVMLGASSDITEYWRDRIAHIGMYNRALSADEVRDLHKWPDLPLWRPRRGISLALVAVGGGAVLPMFGGYNLGKSLLRGANL